MKTSKWLVLCVAAVMAGSAAWSLADDEDAIAKAPAAVQATVKKVLGDKKCEGFDKEEANGKTAYEVNYKVDGVDHATLIAENGDILEEETDVDLKTVPAAVTAAAAKAHADGKVTEAAIVTAGGKQVYELDVTVGKDTHEMRINADGSIVSDTVAQPEGDEKDADQDEAGEKKGKEGDKEDKD
jgi:uncharacterized membrane protein YkoI